MACLLTKLNMRNPMNRIFAALTATLIVLAWMPSARATSDEDFFGLFGRGRQQQPMMQRPMQQRGYPYYGPGSDYFGDSGGGAIPRERVMAPVEQAPGSIFISTTER